MGRGDSRGEEGEQRVSYPQLAQGRAPALRP